MKVVRDGNLTTFNCPEEVYLAERLIKMNPWAGGVRYTVVVAKPTLCAYVLHVPILVRIRWQSVATMVGTTGMYL